MPTEPDNEIAAGCGAPDPPSLTPRALDRRIAGLAIPAMVALATDPLYDLCDTAILGHLGSQQLAGVAVATRILAFGYATFVFVMFATTAAVAHRMGAGQPADAVAEAVGSAWLGAALGLASALVLAVTGPTLISWFGARGGVADDARTYLWVSLGGFPALLIVMAGVGFHRGMERARIPLIVATVSVTANLIGEIVLIFGFGFGVGASAATTVVAKWGSAIVYLVLIRREAVRQRVGWRPSFDTIRRIGSLGAPLVVRTAALLGTLALATAVAARQGTAELAAHSIAFAIWSFTAYLSDGTEVAGQTLVAHGLGAASPADAARAARRILAWAVRIGMTLGVIVMVFRHPLAQVFTSDPEVTASAAAVLVWVAALQPVNAIAFTLDGILIGASRQRALAAIMVVAAGGFAVAATGMSQVATGLWPVWFAMAVFMLARLVPALWVANRTVLAATPSSSR